MASTSASDELIPAAVLVPILIPPPVANESDLADAGLSAQAVTSVTLLGASGPISIPSNSKILFTKRTQHLEHHKGQISFPGGVFEPQDRSLQDTALREAQEEIGLDPRDVEVVGELPEVPTVATRFLIRPYIGLIRKRPVFSVNADEIEEMLFVPLSHLLDPQHSVLENYERNGLRFQLKAYHFGTHRIWGATAVVLRNLLEKHVK